MDGTMAKAHLGEGGAGTNPTDRGKKGTKRSLLTGCQGAPLAAAVDGAHRHDMKLVQSTLEAVVIERPQPAEG